MKGKGTKGADIEMNRGDIGDDLMDDNIVLGRSNRCNMDSYMESLSATICDIGKKKKNREGKMTKI